MKKGIHPEYMETKVTCGSCGNTFTVRSNRPELEVEICNQCHPYYTGKQSTVKKDGRIDKFNKKYGLNHAK